MASSKKEPKGIAYFALGCSALIAIAGLFPVVTSFASVTNWLVARQWVEGDALAQEADLQMEKRTSSRGREVTSYKLTCRYTYQFEGNEYVGTHVSMDDRTMDMTHWQQRWLDRLRAAVASQEPLAVYINPDDPEMAVLDRDFDGPGFAFLLCFGLFVSGGGVWMFGKVRGKMKEKARIEALQQEFVDTPWRARPEWQEDRILPSEKGPAKSSFLFGIYFVLASLPLWVWSLPEALKFGGGGESLLMMGTGCLLGPAVLVGAVVQSRARAALRDSRLVLDEVPVASDGIAHGRVYLAPVSQGIQGMRCTIRCLRIKVGSRRTDNKTVFKNQEEFDEDVRVEPDGSVSVPFAFELPDFAPGHDESNPDDRINWKLTVKPTGVGGKVEFILPVFEIEGEIVEPDLVSPEEA